jgi:Aldo/keto reductases, related to diketogulonate reductase
MQYVTLSTGARMPKIGFGTWQISNEQVGDRIHTALKVGYRHIDTAAVYGNEAGIGQALQEAKIPREELFITTKVWKDDYRAADLPGAVDRSLEKLQMDYVDLLLLHWPHESVALEETMPALNAVARAGKAKAIGVSNFPTKLLQKAIELSEVPIVTNQIEYHPFLNQNKVLNFARAHNISITAYSPLARGKVNDNPVLNEIGAKYNKSASQVALRWLVEQEGVIVIPKASSEKNMRANFEIFDFALDDSDRAAIASLANNTRILNPEWGPEWDN